MSRFLESRKTELLSLSPSDFDKDKLFDFTRFTAKLDGTFLTFSWGAVGSVINLLTTQLNSLSNGSVCALGPTIYNTGTGVGAYQAGMLHIHLASAAFVDPSYINVYLVPSTDTTGGTFTSFNSTFQANLSNYLVATVYIKGTTGVQDETFSNVFTPLGAFQCCIVTGGSCPTLAASGSTVDLFPTPTIVA